MINAVFVCYFLLHDDWLLDHDWSFDYLLDDLDLPFSADELEL